MKKIKISQSVLKYIAIITMLIDHIGVLFVKEMSLELYNSCRMIGRLAFPIFCFCLVEGFLHTSSFWKYMFRIALFAVVSEIPFDLFISGKPFAFTSNNVMFTLLIALFVIYGISKLTFRGLKGMLLTFLIVSVGMLSAYLLKTDYSYKGILLVVFIYLGMNDRAMMYITGTITLWLGGSYLGMTGPLAFIPIHFYNGQRGRQMKYLFYVFYPTHMLLLGFIKIFLL